MNLDAIKAMNDSMAKAIESGDTAAFVEKLNAAVSENVQDAVAEMVMAKYEELKDVKDAKILASRGVVALTSEEEKFYNTLMPRDDAGLTNVTVALPVTVETRVFENVTREHPLLSAIDFKNNKGITEWIISKNLDYAGAWGDLNDAVGTGAAAAFAKVSFSQFKLSTYIPVPVTMLDLGMVWIDQFVVMYLSEIIARKLEDAVVNGTGQKMPVGMIKTVDIENQTVPAVTKTAKAITDLSTTTIGEIASDLCDGGKRVVSVIDMIVNPVDYWKLVYPALYYTNHDGQVVKSNVPLNVIISSAVASDHAVFGICKNYFATAGFGATNGKIAYSDHAQFLADVRLYKARCVAYGTPKDNTSFIYADISGMLEAAIPTRSQKAKS